MCVCVDFVIVLVSFRYVLLCFCLFTVVVYERAECRYLTPRETYLPEYRRPDTPCSARSTRPPQTLGPRGSTSPRTCRSRTPSTRYTSCCCRSCGAPFLYTCLGEGEITPHIVIIFQIVLLLTYLIEHLSYVC